MDNNLRLSAEDAVDVKCEECGHNIFEEVVILKRFSKLLTGSPEDMVVPVNTFACKKCGHINKEFIPKADKSSQLLG